MKDFEFKCVIAFMLLLGVLFIGSYIWVFIEFFKELR